MLDFLDSPILWLILGAFSLFIVYVEMPPKVNKKNGKKISLGQRLSRLSRTGWGFLIPGILFPIGAVAGLIPDF
ncbi:hypothetical protein JOF28_002722 [Leucobacter exalbidus]|uniref:Uncharacterized protein n=1 Tax=Leucobacter exalbidus TaxID=662960 RepID=A0A940PQX8_9MICO|nr:hypothetical protein [Leucobacter exalbidus]